LIDIGAAGYVVVEDPYEGIIAGYAGCGAQVLQGNSRKLACFDTVSPQSFDLMWRILSDE